MQGEVEGRSAWTGKKSEALITVRLSVRDRFGRLAGEKDFLVEPQHEEDLRRWIAYLNRHAGHFLALISVFTAVGVVAALLLHVWDGVIWLIRGMTIGMGLTALVFPFATPETNEAVGHRKGRALARGGGWLLLAIGIGTFFIGP